MSQRRRWMITIGAAAAVLTIAMTATAPGVSLRKMVKKEVAKQLAGKTGPAGAPGANGASGAPGSALGYARVVVAGADGADVIEAQTSPGISDADVSFSAGAGNAYCFTGLPFTPSNVQVTEHFGGAGTTIVRSLAETADTGNCPGSADQVTVYFTDAATVGAGVQTPFFILFN